MPSAWATLSLRDVWAHPGEMPTGSCIRCSSCSSGELGAKKWVLPEGRWRQRSLGEAAQRDTGGVGRDPLTCEGVAGDRSLQRRLRGASRAGAEKQMDMRQKSHRRAGETSEKEGPCPEQSPSM